MEDKGTVKWPGIFSLGKAPLDNWIWVVVEKAMACILHFCNVLVWKSLLRSSFRFQATGCCPLERGKGVCLYFKISIAVVALGRVVKD